MISLTKAHHDDAALIHRLQCEAFMPLYERYHDDETSPAKEPLERVIAKIESGDTDFYIISVDGETVGAVRVVREGLIDDLDTCRISPVFILPGHQNKGIGSEIMDLLFKMYDVQRWRLSTILQEQMNCHFYEKHGFVRNDSDTVELRDGMTLVFYEKLI